MDFGAKLSVLILAAIICEIFLPSALGSDDETSQSYFLTQNQTIYALPGDNLLLTCLVKKKKEDQVIWYKGSQILFANDMKIARDTKYSISTKPGFNVTIPSAVSEDEGEYYCKINTHTAPTQTIKVIVNIPPNVTRNTPQMIHAKVGQNVTLNCSATGKPHPVITWTKQNGKLPNGEGSSRGNILMFTDIDGRHNGGYLCTATNGAGSDDSASVTLDIKFGAKIVSNHVNKIHTGLKRSLQLICAYEGNPRAEARWYNTDGEITAVSNDNIMIDVHTQQNEDVSSLRMKSVRLLDMSEYFCAVNNTLGEDRATFIVTGLPTKPEIKSNSHAHHSDMYTAKWMVLSAEKPEGYKVMLRTSAVENVTEAGDWENLDIPGEESRPQPSADQLPDYYTHSYLLQNLTPSTSYEIQIQAKNSFGWGDLSDSFFFDTREEGYEPPTTTTVSPTTPKPAPASSSGVEYNIDSRPIDKNKNSNMKISSGPFNSAELSSLGLWTGLCCLFLSVYNR